MKSLVLLLKAAREIRHDEQRRLLRKQIAATVATTVEKVVLYPAGQNGNGTKEDRFADVFFKNGSERRIEPSEWVAPS